MRAMTFLFTVSLVWTTALGCDPGSPERPTPPSSEEAGPSEPSDEKGPSESPAAPEEKPEPVDGETTPAPPAEEVTSAPTELLMIAGGMPSSCNEVCGKRGFTCKSACKGVTSEQVAGWGRYSYSKNNFTTYKERDVATCTEQVSSSFVADFGSTYSLDEFRCCCEAPKTEQVAMPLDALQSCDALCGSLGKQCNPKTPFGPNHSGAQLEFKKDSGSRCYTTAECGYVPTGQERCVGSRGTLVAVTCGCWQGSPGN